MADGLIWLRQSEQRNSVVRKLEIARMRGQATLAGLHSFRIDSAGIHVFSLPAVDRPQLRAAPHPSRQRVRMGVEGLDAMLGGGLPRGYSLLVAGPSGAGKSILASSFLVEGAAEGTATASGWEACCTNTKACWVAEPPCARETQESPPIPAGEARIRRRAHESQCPFLPRCDHEERFFP
ncbi:ATPase domain-containing protein [Ramlibacter monticola]|uniref:ATPase domain-containing protein n=1 Tax=Ramlibacter monticola TaxID=1926872 RepID=UPI0038B48B34